MTTTTTETTNCNASAWNLIPWLPCPQPQGKFYRTAWTCRH